MKRRPFPEQGSMLTLMGIKDADRGAPLHITREERDREDNVLELHTVGVPIDDEQEEESRWAYWLSHSAGA